MNVEELLTDLEQRGITVWAEGDKLRYRAVKGVLTPSLRQILVEHKAELLASLLQQQEAETRSSLPAMPPPLQPSIRPDQLPLSFAQERLWFLQQLNPDLHAYNEFGASRLLGRLHVQALWQSFNEIIRRHEILRTSFPMNADGKPVQVIAPTLQLQLPVLDLSVLPQDQRSAAMETLLSTVIGLSFNMERVPLLRIYLVRLTLEEHMLFITLHHIISDGWSARILFQELESLYIAYSQGKPSPLPELSLQYADYVLWQRQWLQGAVLEHFKSYWRHTLAGAPALLELPADHIRPAEMSYRGAHYFMHIPSRLQQALLTLSRSEGVTLFMTLLASLQVLLWRYSGQEDMVLGTQVAARSQSGLDQMIGFFTNTLVLRTDISGNPQFRALLKRVRNVFLDAYEHQFLPFDKLVEILQPERNLSYTPLVQVLFVLHTSLSSPATELDLPDLSFKYVPQERGTTRFDLLFSLTEMPDGLWGEIEYNTDIFESPTIQRLCTHWLQLLEDIIAQPRAPIADLTILPEKERLQLLQHWNATDTHYPQPMLLHELVTEQAHDTPDALALVWDDGQLTYQELNVRANQLAHHLQQAGVGPEVLVGVYLERSPEMVIALLAILKAGGAYVPLDPSYPTRRLTSMLDESHPLLVLTKRTLEPHFLAPDIRVIYLDSENTVIAQQDSSDPISPVCPSNLAYVIYTSGSTGTPKGAMNTHKGICNRLLWMQATYQLTPMDRVLLKTPFTFDVSLWEFFWPLLSGACLVLAHPEGHRDSAYLVSCIQQQAISTLHFVPPMLQAFIEEPALEECLSLRQVICSGQALPFELQERFFARFTSVALHNLYGPTEAAVDVSFWACQPQSTSRIVPIGAPIANIQLYVLDNHLQPTPIGVPGELYIGGVGLARGYLQRPDLTAERFVPHPFASGERLYQTGDRARWLASGAIEFLGRIDTQVKLRGFRIELAEIEAVLLQHEEIQAAAVLLREDPPGHDNLVAYIVPVATRPAPATQTLKAYLSEHLPEYMIPAAFVTLPNLPVTAYGKLNRDALPAPTRIDAQLGSTDIAPRTPIETTLVRIWSEVLGLFQIGIHDNFFELGGDSIQVIQVCARARLSHLQLTPRQIFQYKTIAQLAMIVTPTPTAPSPNLEMVPGPIPLTPIQHWFFGQDLPEPHHWNQALLLSTPTPLRLFALRQALAHLISHHAAFRLSFSRDTTQGWLQRLEPFSSLQGISELLSLVDMSALPASQQASLIAQQCTQAQGSLNLERPPLLRALLLLRGAGRSPLLLLVLHHLIVDTFSWSILLQDLATAYQQACDGSPIHLLPATTSFPAFADLSEQTASSPALLQEAPFWLRQTELAHTLAPLPRDFPQSAQENHEVFARAVQVQLTRQETDALLHQVPAAYQTQINEVLLTALALTLRTWTGSQQLFLNLEGHGRQGWEELAEEADLSRSVGWFTVLFPLVLSLQGRHSLEQCLLAIKEQVRAVPRQGTGYGLLRYLGSDPELRQALATPLTPRISFNYLGVIQQGNAQEHAGFSPTLDECGPVFSLEGTRPHLLDLLGQVRDGQLQLSWIYSQQIHARSTIERLAQHYGEALRRLIAHCLTVETQHYTPSDFPNVGLSQTKLNKIVARMRSGKQQS